VIFSIFGHPNTLCTHRNTIEFTKDKVLSLKGDCIFGVKADFSYDDLIGIVKRYDNIKITITLENYKEVINAKVNKGFDDKHEIVIRRSDFSSKRTLGIKADRVAMDINREFVKRMKYPNAVAKVEVTGI